VGDTNDEKRETASPSEGREGGKEGRREGRNKGVVCLSVCVFSSGLKSSIFGKSAALSSVKKRVLVLDFG